MTTLVADHVPAPRSAPPVIPAPVAELVRAAGSRIDEGRRLPADVVGALTSAGLFRLYTPVEHGGAELSPAAFCAVVAEAARLDASVAWCLWNGNCGFAAALLEPASAEAVFGRGVPVGNSARAAGTAEAVEGGYRLHGQWDLVSGSDHQPWVILFGIVTDHGEPRFTEHGPDLRAFFVRAEQCDVIDRWHVMGLRGTASNPVVVDDAFVPESFAPAPFAPTRIDRALYRVPVFTTASCGGAAVCLGTARGAIDDVLALVGQKTSIRGGEPLAQHSDVQRAIAEADIRLRAAEGALRDALDTVFETATAGEAVDVVARGRVRAAMTLAARTSREVTLAMFELGSSTAIYDSCTLSRRMRDVLVAAQHVMLQPIWYEEAGRTLVGLQPSLPVL